jgi:hypothetical protein
MKSFLKKAIDSTVLPLIRHIASEIPPHPPSSTILGEIQRRVSIECADYVESKMPKAVTFPTKIALRDHALAKVEIDGIFAEFGVFRGASINQIANHRPNDIIYGFDSFEGLMEDWAGHDCIKGTFDLGGELPMVASNVRLIKGWFHKTIPDFLAQNLAPFAFIHCDCDTYEAAKIILGLAGKRVQKGTVIVFDEYFGYRGWKNGEFKAWQELVSSSTIVYEYLGFTQNQVSIRVTDKQ